MSVIEQMRVKVLDYYSKLPKQVQLYYDQISLALDNMIHAHNETVDAKVVVEVNLMELQKKYDKLQVKFNELNENYEKLNRKVNSGLIK